MIEQGLWLEIATVKILLRELRGKLFLLGRFELADIPWLREGMILLSFGADPSECERACRALGFLTAEADAEHGVFSRWAGN